MKVFRGIWWLLGAGYSLLCFGYAVAFIGWGFSWWNKPEPGTFLLILAFLGAGIDSVDRNIEELDALSRPHHSTPEK
jgi:4-amino-4-deoxy-L-arabinose transferase-like glycosyltransferase